MPTQNLKASELIRSYEGAAISPEVQYSLFTLPSIIPHTTASNSPKLRPRLLNAPFDLFLGFNTILTIKRYSCEFAMSGNDQGDKDKREQQLADDDFLEQLTHVVVAGKASAERRRQNKEKKEKEEEDEKKKEMFKRSIDAAAVSKERRMKEEIGFF